MTRYWVLGLIVAVVVVIYLVRRSRDAAATVDVPVWEADRRESREPDPVNADAQDDTAPAVLSPPEWKPPKSTSNGSQR